VETNKGSNSDNSEVEKDTCELTSSQQQLLESVSTHLKVQKLPLRGIFLELVDQERQNVSVRFEANTKLKVLRQ